MRLAWFLNSKDERSHYLRLCLKLHQKQYGFSYQEIPISFLSTYNLTHIEPEKLSIEQSFVWVEHNNKQKIILFDNTDGFTHLSPLITDVDLYFCGPFCSAFHIEKEFIPTYPWQSRYDLTHYQQRAQVLVQLYGEHFYKVRPLIPMPPLFPRDYRVGKRALLRNPGRLVDFITSSLFRSEHAAFARRWHDLLGLRGKPLRYDIVALDHTKPAASPPTSVGVDRRVFDRL